MGPWSKPTNARTQSSTGNSSSSTLGPAEWALMIGLAALVVLGAAVLWCSRYEIGIAAGVPTRLDRFTGQVIGCVPGQGCLELIPAGQPTLRSAVVQRVPGGAPNAAATGNATPAGAPPSPTPTPPAPDKPHG